MSSIAFTVHGTPMPQGNIIGQVLGTRIMGGKAVLAPRVLLVDKGDMSGKVRKDKTRLPGKRLSRWKAKVDAYATAAMTGASFKPNHELCTGPVTVTAAFFFERPKTHWTPKGALSAAGQRHPIPPIDVDKLTRSILDAMTGVVYKDDRQVAVVHASKWYCVFSEESDARVEIVVKECTL